MAKKKAASAVVAAITLDQQRALEILTEIAEGTAESECVEPHARIAAMNLIGKWSKWETGTAAENKAADALSDEITAARAR